MKVLFICHNHPQLHPGGTEVMSHALFREIAGRAEHEAFYLACTNELHRRPNPGTPFLALDGAHDEMLLFSGHFDRFRLSQLDLHGIVPELATLLRTLAPDVVHFHHLLLIGVEALKVVRDALPQARIVLTLHDYYPICHHNGQMIRVDSDALCERGSPRRCAGCFPDRDGGEFLTRELHVKTFLSLVDRFIAPSEFLRSRYVTWGIDPGRIEVVRNGCLRASSEPAPAPRVPAGSRTVVGFFGNLSRQKGIPLLLEAAGLLARRPGVDIDLRLHGRAWFQPEDFDEELRRSVDASEGRIRAHGAYRREELPALLASVDAVVVPSIWWENDPIVIQEAFWAGRPVICADIGGMAEAVRDGIDGLHFRAGDALSLADALERFAAERREGIRYTPSPPPTIDAVADRHLHLYRQGSRRLPAPSAAATGD